MDERPQTEGQETIPEVEASTPENFHDVLKSGLNEPETKPEERPTEEPVTEPREPEGEKDETLFGELVLSEADKIQFKTQAEFDAFIKQNPLLNNNFVPKPQYTRITQEKAEREKALEKLEAEKDAFWTDGLPPHVPKIMPNDESKGALKALFAAYQVGGPEYQQALSQLVQQANGLLHGQHTAQPVFHPEVTQLKTELESVKAQLDQFNQAQAVQAWQSWSSQKEKTGVKIGDDVRQIMAQAMKYDRHDGQPFTFDDAYNYAIFQLGKTNEEATRKVFARTQTARKQSPAPINSGVSTNVRPEAKTFRDVLTQGLEQLA